jgi:hypothetical protein
MSHPPVVSDFMSLDGVVQRTRSTGLCGVHHNRYALVQVTGDARTGWKMIREVLSAIAITGSTISMAPCAAADPGHWEGDVPGMNYYATLGAPCDNYEHNIFGRGPSGQAEACHFPPPNQFPAATTGYWVISPALYGVQQAGAKCPGSQAAAQSDRGLPMLCLGAQGWQEGWFTGAGFFPPSE